MYCKTCGKEISSTGGECVNPFTYKPVHLGNYTYWERATTIPVSANMHEIMSMPIQLNNPVYFPNMGLYYKKTVSLQNEKHNV